MHCFISGYRLGYNLAVGIKTGNLCQRRLRAFVSEDALNELSRLAAQYSDVNCTPEDIKLYLERIARGTPVASRAASMSTNDIEQYLQSMREQKQGTADAEDSV